MRPLLPMLLLVGLVVACETAPVEWGDPTSIAASAGPFHLVFDSSGQPRLVPDAVPLGVRPADSALCSTSLQTTRGATKLFATWWSVRRDSNATLDAAWSSDGGKTWGTPVAVDTSDVSARGCKRPPPSIATVGDDLYVAYSMAAPEGTGVFFAHFMGSMLHSPVSVIYGERLVPTAIAAEGDRVAVAYEEPNGTRKQVDVSLSLTQGHIFERHAIASRDVDAATQPLVALSGDRVAVSWITRRQIDSTGAHVVRVGRIP